MNKYQDHYGLNLESGFHATRRDVTVNLLQRYLDSTKFCNILDVGCGNGNITIQVRKHFPSANIDAIDISEDAIKNAIKATEGVNFFLANIYTYSPDNLLYDAIILNNIYEHLENPINALINVKKLLKENGIVIISTPNRYHIKNIFRVILGLNIVIPKYHVTEYSIGQLFDHHNYVGLRVEKVITPKFRYEKFRLINFMLFSLFQPIADTYLKFRRSYNRTGSLLFIISRLK